MFGLLEQEWFVVLRVSGGDCHVLFYLGQIFQGLTGQGSCVVLISLFILCRDRKMGEVMLLVPDLMTRKSDLRRGHQASK